MPLHLRARVVFRVDLPPIEDGVVTIEGERISEVGTTAGSDELIDLGDTALVPGFVNAHTHLEFSYLRQPLGRPGMSLVDWIRLVIAERRRADFSPNPQRGVLESRASGVTTIGDISTSAQTLYDASHFDATHFHEVIGFSRARAESAMIALTERINFQPTANNLYIRQGFSPHAPYTVSPKLLVALIWIARRFDWPVAMHLAESRDELELLSYGTGTFQALLDERGMWDPNAIPHGSRPLDYLRMLAEAPRALAIHGNYLDEEEIQFLASHRDRMSLVYCPRTHAYFFHPPYPLEQALAAGVRVALGTDSRASNPDLSLLEEMRHVSRTHPRINPQQVLRMGTLDAAEALGRSREVGSIAATKLANLVAIPLPTNATLKPDELLQAAFADELLPAAIWIRGQQLKPAAN